jgi:lysophospholipid acyltransferase (LPLAT)-like uncharacterized protein
VSVKITPFQRFQGWGLSTYAGLVWRTARYQIEGQEYVGQVHTAGRPLIIAAWHGMTMMLGGYVAAQDDPAQYVMIAPDDSRGAVLIAWARRLGATPFTISMEANSMVAARRLLALIRQMKQGKSLVLNPDGPGGPSHEPKGGVAFIARKARALIVPAQPHHRRLWRTAGGFPKGRPRTDAGGDPGAVERDGAGSGGVVPRWDPPGRLSACLKNLPESSRCATECTRRSGSPRYPLFAPPPLPLVA